jgi:hypothetical protein
MPIGMSGVICGETEIKIPRRARDGMRLFGDGCRGDRRRQTGAQKPKAVDGVEKATACGGTIQAPALPCVLQKLRSMIESAHPSVRPLLFFLLVYSYFYEDWPRTS